MSFFKVSNEFSVKVTCYFPQPKHLAKSFPVPKGITARGDLES